jgi:hypothetical protein
MRRYLGNTWLSVRETASLLHVSAEAVELLARRNGLSCCWFRELMPHCSFMREPVPYFSKKQVEQLVLRFDSLDAAFSDWPPND